MQHRLQADRNCSFDEFTTIVHQLLMVAWGTDWGTFVQAFPNGNDPTKAKLPIITYHSKGKRPAVIGKNGVQEIKPRIRSYYKETEDGTEAVNVYAQSFDYNLVFEVWAESNTEADQMAERFENFMMTYTGYFMQNGVQQLIFQEQLDETAVMKWREAAVVRSFRYLLRLEKQTEESIGVITEIIGKVDALRAAASNDSIDEESIHFKIPEGGNNQ